MVAAERAVDGRVAALRVAVRMLAAVRADDAAPALRVDVGQHQPLIGQPAQHAVAAGVADLDGLEARPLVLARRHAQRLADRGQRVLAARVELNQPRREVIAPALQVDRAGQAAVADGVDGAGVGVARRCDGLDGGRERALGRLLTEGVAPLERALRRLHDPCGRERRHLGLGADVVQHHEQDELDVLALGRRFAVGEAADDIRAGVDIPAFAVAALVVRQEGRERRLGRTVLIILNFAVAQCRLLPQDQRSFALWRQTCDVF